MPSSIPRRNDDETPPDPATPTWSPPGPATSPESRLRQDRAVELCDCVVDIVSALFGTCGREMRQPGRGANDVARARQVAMYVCHVALGLRMIDIGRGFGRDRTTVMHACHLIEDLRDDEEFDRLIADHRAGVVGGAEGAPPLMMSSTQDDKAGTAKDLARLLRFLRHGEATLGRAARTDALLLQGGERGTVSVRRPALEEAARRGLVERQGDRLALSASGHALAVRGDDPADGFRAQHQERVHKTMEVEGIRQAVELDLSESPLTAIAARKDRKGRAFLDGRELRAGERLRSDYTRGRLVPRLGANWQAAVASGRRDGGAGGMAELTDAALAARQRVDHALAAVGPELSGVLVDVCCFLKGLEQVEMERGWPQRSAKVVLKTALAALARHYEPERTGPRSGSILHWGAENYRPRIGGVQPG